VTTLVDVRIFLIAICLIVVGGLAWLFVVVLDVDPGIVWQAWEAIAATGAFIAAGVLLAREQRALRAADEDRRRQHAEQLAFWIEGIGGANSGDFVVHLRNSSQQTMWAILVTVPHVPVQFESHFASEKPSYLVGALPPGVSASVRVKLKETEALCLPVGTYRTAEIRFRDGSNRWWLRSPSGLKPIDPMSLGEDNVRSTIVNAP
jgi:hypothetical protein